MDLAAACKEKLIYFRIKELKDVLNKLGLAKQGKKQDLVDRILAGITDDQGSKGHGWMKRNCLGREEIAKIIDDTYRKMQAPGATELASKVKNSSNNSGIKIKEDVDESVQDDTKMRCLCGSSLSTETTMKCEDAQCNVWQHVSCVIIPEKPLEGSGPEIPPQFYCELCRLNRADPFWMTMGHPLYPVKMIHSNLTTEGGNPIQTVERTFNLSRSDKELLQKSDYDIQAWCMLLNDKVPFRMQWPQYADLQVNGVQIRTTNRPGSQLLGINGRDDGLAITTCSREGVNKIALSGCDARIFCMGVRIVKRRTLQQVLNQIPKEGDGERFEDALARVCRCIGGGNTGDNADSDSDLEVVAESVSVNLRCPMSGSRIKIAGRFRPCVHMGCFDLETFIELNQRSRKWQCPICLKNFTLEHVIIDPYFSRITSMMRNCGEDVTEIEVKPDGSWRAKNETEHRDLMQWHKPDGSLYVVESDVDMKLNQQSVKQIKQEAASDAHIPIPLKIGIKRNRDGIWEVSKPEDMRTLSSSENGHKVLLANSSATGSYRDGEDTSVNQDDRGQFDFSINNGHELESMSLNFDATYNTANQVPSALAMEPDVIVLSDSEEDNVQLISPEDVYDTGHAEATGMSFPIHPNGTSDPYADSSLPTNGNSCLGLFNNNSEDYGIPSLWQPVPQNGPPGFQFFTDTECHHTLIDEHHDSNLQMNDYGLINSALNSASQAASQSQACHPNDDIMVDNPLALVGDDPSLRMFLPTRPGTAARTDLRYPTDISNDGRTEDWISLRLGGGGDQSTLPGNDANLRNQFPSKEECMDSLDDTASLLLSMNEERSDKSAPNRPNFGDPFSHPRQRRTARAKIHLSIQSDSE